MRLLRQFFMEVQPFQNDGYIKVMELVSHIVIEINHSPTATTDETRKQNNPELKVKEPVCNLKKWENNTTLYWKIIRRIKQNFLAQIGYVSGLEDIY